MSATAEATAVLHRMGMAPALKMLSLVAILCWLWELSARPLPPSWARLRLSTRGAHERQGGALDRKYQQSRLTYHSTTDTHKQSPPPTIKHVGFLRPTHLTHHPSSLLCQPDLPLSSSLLIFSFRMYSPLPFALCVCDNNAP